MISGGNGRIRVIETGSQNGQRASSYGKGNGRFEETEATFREIRTELETHAASIYEKLEGW